MAALTKEYGGPTQGARQHVHYVVSVPVAGNVKIYNGALVMTNAAGFAVPASDAIAAANAKVIGRANSTIDTTASGPQGVLADGVLEVECSVGLLWVGNPSGANQLVAADRMKLAYVLSDNEVIKAAGTTNSVIAGRLLRLDAANNFALIDTLIKAV